jgi:hypothetical protein
MTDVSPTASLGKYLMQFITTIQEENLAYLERTRERWQNFEDETKFAADQSKRKLESMADDFKHENNMKKIDRAEALRQAEMAAKQATERYEKFLSNVGTLRDKIEGYYPEMSPAYVDIIYHHACEILDRMFKESDQEQRKKYQQKLIMLMQKIHEDTAQDALLDPNNPKRLPMKTLEYIEKA